MSAKASHVERAFEVSRDIENKVIEQSKKYGKGRPSYAYAVGYLSSVLGSALSVLTPEQLDRFVAMNDGIMSQNS